MNRAAFNKYVVVGFCKGSAYMLQMRGVMNWYFDNNHLKVFKSLTGALKDAHKARCRYKLDDIRVYRIFDNDDYITCCEFTRWAKEQPERIVGYIDCTTKETYTGESAREMVASLYHKAA